MSNTHDSAITHNLGFLALPLLRASLIWPSAPRPLHLSIGGRPPAPSRRAALWNEGTVLSIDGQQATTPKPTEYVGLPSYYIQTTINPTTDSFKESLTIRTLQDGKLHTLFKVELTSTDQQSTRPLESLKSKNINQLKTDLLPLWILELVDRYGIHQLGLSLARGRWEVIQEAQSGVRSEPQANATELTNILAGILCARLNRLTLLKDPPLILFNPSPVLSLSSILLDVTAASFSEGLFQQALPEWSSSIPLFPSSFWTGIIILSLG
ncbi:Subunit of the glycosylphosphatidylinositol transamidase complex-like protein [Puccinia graminis f. sp. tritici]|uniref:Subunit of the glycosylphosphatidylinositol transamidase complex-like protein n=1 Tax=Puccinia graminis f. sp. tritici TaxID=56615 RepID=A0A5B0QK89_PUCGR|nr:Subunit of the glycosylphosphatidylinositol transamidase complex-like protein [Puccinia graminis f. sp. tritici]